MPLENTPISKSFWPKQRLLADNDQQRALQVFVESSLVVTCKESLCFGKAHDKARM